MGRRQNFMGQKAPSRPDTVIGSKKAGVQTFDLYRYWLGVYRAKPIVGIDRIGRHDKSEVSYLGECRPAICR